MTANVRDADRAMALAAGMDDVLPEPIAPVELWAVLGRAAEIRQVASV
jgi:CheY-like chemotaxis protein